MTIVKERSTNLVKHYFIILSMIMIIMMHSLSNTVFPQKGNDKFLVWHTYADFAEEEPRFEQLAARFKTAEIAGRFKAAFEECQQNLGKVRYLSIHGKVLTPECLGCFYDVINITLMTLSLFRSKPISNI